jgi:hypothetical protein
VSTAEQPNEPRVTIYPEEALRRARPLPPRESLVIKGAATDTAAAKEWPEYNR